MLTQKDFDKFEKLIKQVVDEELDEKIPKYIKYLPTKDEFYTEMNNLMGEVKAIRESQELHVGAHSEINDRLDRIDNRLHIHGN